MSYATAWGDMGCCRVLSENTSILHQWQIGCNSDFWPAHVLALFSGDLGFPWLDGNEVGPVFRQGAFRHDIDGRQRSMSNWLSSDESMTGWAITHQCSQIKEPIQHEGDGASRTLRPVASLRHNWNLAASAAATRNPRQRGRSGPGGPCRCETSEGLNFQRHQVVKHRHP